VARFVSAGVTVRQSKRAGTYGVRKSRPGGRIPRFYALSVTRTPIETAVRVFSSEDGSHSPLPYQCVTERPFNIPTASVPVPSTHTRNSVNPARFVVYFELDETPVCGVLLLLSAILVASRQLITRAVRSGIPYLIIPSASGHRRRR